MVSYGVLLEGTASMSCPWWAGCDLCMCLRAVLGIRGLECADRRWLLRRRHLGHVCRAVRLRGLATRDHPSQCRKSEPDVEVLAGGTQPQLKGTTFRQALRRPAEPRSSVPGAQATLGAGGVCELWGG